MSGDTHKLQFKTGTLVEFRNRPWVVLQSEKRTIMKLKPLGGTDDEITGVYLPLYADKGCKTEDKVIDTALVNLGLKSWQFNPPELSDLNSNPHTRHLFLDACRLSFRDISGPFMSLGRLSFQPRPYQMVPLLLALKQEHVRLMIADDVGIGKTLESLLIAREMLARKEIKRFAVICLPHLCEQWQNEIKDKFGLDAHIIRSSTVTRLEKSLRQDQNIFRDLPYIIVSIDYIKQDNRRALFVDHCPEFVIVDEAHTCALPHSQTRGQQLRHSLIKDIASREGQHMVMLTATPHSGHTEEFQSLIGMLNPEFASFDLSTPKQRESLSKHFVQRRRADIRPYLGDGENVFPERMYIGAVTEAAAAAASGRGRRKKDEHLVDAENYVHSQTYSQMLQSIIDYVQEGMRNVANEDRRTQRTTYWDLLSLMRGVMSSPEAGIRMLQNKLDKKAESAEVSESTDEVPNIFAFNDSLKDLLTGDDVVPETLEAAKKAERERFSSFINVLESIKENDDDNKVRRALDIVKFALSEGMNPIIFCQYIQTAEYVGDYIRKALSSDKKLKNISIATITSRLADEERKIKIEELSKTEQHVLVCTDCLSEGVNLQTGFDAVIHYDLPWNPNRVEQRNGRIDRFGQLSAKVMIATLHSSQNPVDDIVLRVLYRKQEEIRKRLGVYLPISDNDESLMESIMQRVMEYGQRHVDDGSRQLSLFESMPEVAESEMLDKEFMVELKSMEDFERKSHTYFAHNTRQMDPANLKNSLNAAAQVMGTVEDTCNFVVCVLENMLHLKVKKDSELCYSFFRNHLFNYSDTQLRKFFSSENQTGVAKSRSKQDANRIRISFASPTPKNYMYVGRNHSLVEYLSRAVLNETIKNTHASRARLHALENGTEQSSASPAESSSDKARLRGCRAMVMKTAAVQEKTTVLMMRVRSVISDVKNPERELVGEEMIFMGYQGKIEDRKFITAQQAREIFDNATPASKLEIAQQQQVFADGIDWTYDEHVLRSYTDDVAQERAEHMIEAFSMYRIYARCPEYQYVSPVLPMDVIGAYIYLPA